MSVPPFLYSGFRRFYNRPKVTAKRQITSRVLLVVALLCAVVCAQAASLISEQLHQHSSQHCCALCHIGPLPFLQPAIAAYSAPVLATEWFEWSVELDTPHEVLLAAGYSRAPPA
jgi:hypothetical protein